MKRFLAFFLALLCLLIPLTATAKVGVDQIGKRCIKTNGATNIPYRLFLPTNYDETKEYPMLVFFHGAGERGNDNTLQLSHCVQYIYDNVPEDCIIVVPQCPLYQQWVDTPWVNGAYSVDNIPESNEIKTVMMLLDDLQAEYSVDKDRIYASGISMGGFATWDVMMRHNDYFAAAIAVCGGGDVTKGELLKDTPLFVFHGDIDTQVPPSGSRDTVQAIKDAGGTLVEYTEFEGMAHGIWNEAFATEGLLEKLFDCRLSTRYPDLFENEESSVPEVIETVSEEISETVSKENTEISTSDSQENDYMSKAMPIIIVVTVIAVLALAAFFILKKRNS